MAGEGGDNDNIPAPCGDDILTDNIRGLVIAPLEQPVRLHG